MTSYTVPDLKAAIDKIESMGPILERWQRIYVNELFAKPLMDFMKTHDLVLEPSPGWPLGIQFEISEFIPDGKAILVGENNSIAIVDLSELQEQKK